MVIDDTSGAPLHLALDARVGAVREDAPTEFKGKADMGGSDAGSTLIYGDGGYIFIGGTIRSGESYEDMLWLKLTPVRAFVSAGKPCYYTAKQTAPFQ